MQGGNTILIVLAIVLVLAVVCCLTLACVGGALFFVYSSESSSGPSAPKPVERADVSDFCAEYQVTDPERTYDEYHATIIFDRDMTMAFVEYVEGEQVTGQGTWSFERSSLTFSFETEAEARFSGTTRGNTNDFTIDGRWSNGVQGEIRLTR
jgi:hypothetical protein